MNQPDAQQWWRDAVIYQVYPRSFADASGDGMGDLAGVTAKLDYLQQLGVDAVWLSPFYRSPQADAGYDVAGYRDVDPLFGSLADFDEMLAAAHQRGLRIIVDLVPNHTSDEHEWFVEAKESAPGSAARERYMFREGRGENGELPPNNWQSIFGGPAWTRLTTPDGSPGQWYLHLFDAKQPDLNWENPEVWAEMESVLRFWLDRGVDGFRVDVAHGMIKAEGLPDWDGAAAMVEGQSSESDEAAPANSGSESHMNPPSPFFDQDGVHEIYRAWNRVLAEYDGDRMLVAEAWVEPAARLVRYIRPDEMQQAFNFEFLLAGWDAARMHEAISNSLEAVAEVGAPSTWVLSNHDTVRHPSRFGLSDPTSYPKGISAEAEQPDESLGLARGRAAAAIELALPGSAYVYQGDELGLPEHTTLPAEARQDPAFFRTEGAETGRDGCRVPLPWRADEPGYGFSLKAAANGQAPVAPWLPQPESFANYAAASEEGVPGSTLELYRRMLELRREYQLGLGELRWNDANDPAQGILSFDNGPVTVMTNFSESAVALPEGRNVILHTLPQGDDGSGAEAAVSVEELPAPLVLAPNATAWLL
ncbi:glycoside hydrolase family 13 protein [Acaricomes phytoseiuli]|uniref:glycoside hydrolase family 13 protein n=1 Tax=Acaricomes phytoseiuli TaxID=291968 RepID=UPI000373F704|nr:glycoside hydrolase family 13 protein [Acaricomes phytoseiuli]MCW1250376.1 glycoside hydrolase family 13 protein [Acaricomes phytoseiuli]